MKTYIGKVHWWNDCDNKEEVCNFFCVGEDYADAMERCIRHFGEDETISITLEMFNDNEFIEFWNEEESIFNEAKAMAIEHALW